MALYAQTPIVWNFAKHIKATITSGGATQSDYPSTSDDGFGLGSKVGWRARESEEEELSQDGQEEKTP